MRITISGLDQRDSEQKYNFILDLFQSEDINMDKILQTNHKHLVAELVTFPSILNKIGVLLAQAERKLKEADLDYKIWKSKEKKKVKDRWDNDPNMPVIRGSKYNQSDVDEEIYRGKNYLVRKKRLNRIAWEKDILNSFYWSAKAKSDQLEKLSLSLQGENIRQSIVSLEGKAFNGVKIETKTSN